MTLNLTHNDFRFFNLNDEFVIPVVVKFDNHRLFRIVNIPENPAAMLVKRAGGNDAWHAGSGQPDTMPPTGGFVGIDSGGPDVPQRDVQLAFERPKLIQSLDFKVKTVVNKSDLDHDAAFYMMLEQSVTGGE
jgi:hypothetical protein